MEKINNQNAEKPFSPQPQDVEELEEWADVQLDSDEEVSALRSELRTVRSKNKSREGEIVHAIKNLRQAKIAEGSKLFGIKLVDEDSEQEKEQRLQMLKKAVSDPESPEQEILKQLGMIDEEGKFTFPSAMFSKKTGQLWRKYLDWVKSQSTYLDISKRGEALPVTNSELKVIDEIRTEKHNELTRSVMADLGVEDNEDNFIFFRRLVAKMRDNTLPNTGEIKTTASKAYDWYDSLSKNKAA